MTEFVHVSPQVSSSMPQNAPAGMKDLHAVTIEAAAEPEKVSGVPKAI